MQKRKPELLDHVRQKPRIKHYSPATDKSYIGWTKRYIHFRGKRHPPAMGVPAIEAFITDLACDRKGSSSPQNQAFNALVFIYRHVTRRENRCGQDKAFSAIADGVNPPASDTGDCGRPVTEG